MLYLFFLVTPKRGYWSPEETYRKGKPKDGKGTKRVRAQHDTISDEEERQKTSMAFSWPKWPIHRWRLDVMAISQNPRLELELGFTLKVILSVVKGKRTFATLDWHKLGVFRKLGFQEIANTLSVNLWKESRDVNKAHFVFCKLKESLIWNKNLVICNLIFGICLQSSGYNWHHGYQNGNQIWAGAQAVPINLSLASTQQGRLSSSELELENPKSDALPF